MKKFALLISAVFLMAAQPGGVPTVISAPTAPHGLFSGSNVWSTDGGPGSVPPVLIQPIYAPSYFEGGGILLGTSGIDGGYPPGTEYHERGTLTSATSPAFTNLAFNFTTKPICICTISSGASSINVCQSQLDAGASAGPTADGGPVTTVVIGTLLADGGTWNYDCVGY